MAYRTITTVVTDARTDAAALAAAARLALRDDAHLDVHCIGIDPARYDAMPLGSVAVVLESGAAEARERADALARSVQGLLPQELTRVAIQSVVVPQMAVESMVARLARYSDLIVMTKPYGEGRLPLHVTLLESVLFGTGVPVLVVPDTGIPETAKFEHVMVAWNESDESFTAIRQTLPVLIAAGHVDIVMVDPPSHSPERSDPGGMVSVMLARHGVRAELSILSRTLPRVSEVLTRFARDRGCDLVVMGAYGHSRFREAILGGATRDILETTSVPLMMAH